METMGSALNFIVLEYGSRMGNVFVPHGCAIAWGVCVSIGFDWVYLGLDVI